MDFLKEPLNFDNHTFRCSSLGLLMTEPQGGSNMEKYLAKKAELEKEEAKLLEDVKKATEKRDAIKNKETKGWSEADSKINTIMGKAAIKIRQLTIESKALEAVKDDISLSATCIDHLIDIYIFALSGREQEIYSKYMDKGKKQEGSGIRILREVDDRFYFKNIERLFNKWINGECDIDFEDDDVVLDTKLSWDFYSFQPKTVKPIDKNYYWQAQGYMELWNRNNFVLCYILDDTPDGMIEDEKKRLLYQIGTHMKDSELYEEACASIEKSMKYSDIPLKFRVIKKPIKRNKDDIERAYVRIEECRKWLNKYAQDEWERVNNISVIPIFPDIIINIQEPSIAKEIEVTIGFESKEEEILNPELKEMVPVSDLPEVQCPQCDSVNIEFKGDNFECNDCGYDSKTDGNVHVDITIEEEETANSKIEIASEKIIYPTTHEQVYTISSAPESKNDEDFNSYLTKINKCTSESECIALYKEIKSNFEKYPTLKDMLTVKKQSFKNVEPVPEPEKPKTTPKPKEETGDITSESIKQKTLACKTSGEIKKLYKTNREFIDKDIDLRNFMQEQGEKLDG